MTPPPSPCTSCVSEDTCPCDAYLLWDELAHPEPRPCPTCSETAYLLDAGEAFAQIPGRLGKSRVALERHLFRHKRGDLIRREMAW